MSHQHQAEHLFHGAFAEEYHFLQRICPAAAEMSHRVAGFVAAKATRQVRGERYRIRIDYPLKSARLAAAGCMFITRFH